MIVLLVVSCSVFVWLIWILGSELMRAVTQQDWGWATTWGAVTIIMGWGLWRFFREVWLLWQEIRPSK
ncbi:hypothetical protein ACFFLM_04275 [Deinococcus oregonensis]|uniref:Uncharacterized protein n=1 Tax=Deinococcus oregonensis TaxID=1805970 RepID=A0ABV6AUM3_9DEIO